MRRISKLPSLHGGEFYFLIDPELETITAHPSVPAEIRSFLDEHVYILNCEEIEFIRFSTKKFDLWFNHYPHDVMKMWCRYWYKNNE